MEDRENGGRTRTVNIHFMVSAEEKTQIDNAIKLSGAKSIREYLTTIALNGYIIQIDMDAFTQLLPLLRRISDNTNQIARRVNETRNIYAEDVKELRIGYEDIKANIGEAISGLKTTLKQLKQGD